MPLKCIGAEGFRNFERLDVGLAEDANYLFGPNASGKTNLLEAVFYLAIGRSFRRARERELIGFDRELMVVAGEDDAGNRAEIRFDGREKRVELNGRRIERLSDFLGWLPVVVLLLDDIELVRGAPSGRRNYLDLAIAKTDRGYIALLNAYRRALAQRNRLLERGATVEEHATWEEELVRTAVPVLERRAETVAPLLEHAAAHFRQLRGGDARFEYRSTVAADGDTAGAMRRGLAATRKRSLEFGHTLVGPHRDDILMKKDGRDLRRFGSVGEQRLGAIALRLAEADVMAGARVGRPVFLLDEIASELDEERSARVLALVAERGQSLYAAARAFDAAGKVFHVETGQVEEVS